MSFVDTMTFGLGSPARTGDAVTLRVPGEGTVLAEVALAGVDDVRTAARTAREAQRGWASTPIAERAEVLARAEALLLEHADELQVGIAHETGSVFGKARVEIDGSVNELRAGRALASIPDGEVYPSPNGSLSYSRRIPVGVVGLITPWNFPVALAMRVIAPALVLGNAVVLKPDTQTPISGGDMLASLFLKAGLPAGLLQSVPGGPVVGEALVSDPDVDMISFTGSTAAGRKVGALAGSLLKRVSLELGGNNPMIVLDSVDIDIAAEAGAAGSFTHQGQICMSTGRHIVHVSVADAYATALASQAATLRLGATSDPATTMGPIINQAQIDRVADIVDRSVAMGATVLTGGTPQGQYYPPTVLTGVTPDMPAFSEELFGPVAVVSTFSSDEEAVTRANSGEYGLSAAVFGSDLARARRLALQLRAGMVHINSITITDTAVTPMGGHGSSGNGGAVGGLSNVEEYTQVRWYTEQDKPFDASF
ncbi:aldehyde dehydrogenase family protein [Microbacterium sp. UCD-TDU]|uniref:aldehyde dehydrogenase family protein n=1 Tax=Microbacterium sp. UCD-TDU TaxID=1247714 RepID=UPI00034A2622|nr:aldehyde dehydrogenase family protein [Microbacterium sp. UCD-TDU]EYT57173.1 benzaldehyde dehydrogenase [Microbacterium sp. UCD-TDU]